MGTRNVPPFRNDVVGSFLRPQVIHEARRNLEAGKITASELRQIEDEEIKKLVAKEIENGLHAVTDGEFRRTYWHLDFLENLEGVEKVKAEEWSVHFKGHQPKAATVKITGKIGFGDSEDFDYDVSSFNLEGQLHGGLDKVKIENAAQETPWPR